MSSGERESHPNALPNYQNAVVSDDKIRLYILNPWHVSRAHGGSSGRDKAVVFKSALGFDTSNWELLKQRIVEELPYYEAALREEDEYGKRYNVLLTIVGPNGNTASVLTAWIIKHGEDFPRFVTALCQ